MTATPWSRAFRVEPSSNGSPPQRDRAGVEVVDAGERLQQRRLAGTVLAEQGVHLTGAQPQRGTVQRDGTAEALHGALHLENDFLHEIHPPLRRVETH